MNKTIEVLEELDRSLGELKTYYEDESIFSDLVARGIETARGKIQSKAIEIRMEELGLSDTHAGS